MAAESSLALAAARPAPGAGAPPAAGAGAATPPRGGGIDTTRVLNLFGYVGPVASLMSHSLFPHGAPAGGARGIQRVPGVGARAGDDGRLSARHIPTGLTPGKTRFVLSRTEDAMDSVLPCAAERMFRRPGKFGNASNLQFSYNAAA